MIGSKEGSFIALRFPYEELTGIHNVCPALGMRCVCGKKKEKAEKFQRLSIREIADCNGEKRSTLKKYAFRRRARRQQSGLHKGVSVRHACGVTVKQDAAGDAAANEGREGRDKPCRTRTRTRISNTNSEPLAIHLDVPPYTRVCSLVRKSHASVPRISRSFDSIKPRASSLHQVSFAR